MSQHHYEVPNENPSKPVVKIRMGWDRPLREFFLNVEKHSAKGRVTNMFTSLRNHVSSVDDMKEVLQKLKLTTPELMFIEVERDCMQGVGNRVAIYDAAGVIKEDHRW